MRLQVRLAVLLVVVLAAVAVIAPAAMAQTDPTPGPGPVPVRPELCTNLAPYDHNRDGRVNGDDFTLWVVTVHETGGESCKLNGNAAGCPSWIDVNRDGIVSTADLDKMLAFLMGCVYPVPKPGIQP